MSSPLVLGAATRTNVELLHSALSGWRQCHGRVVFIEPAQTFTLTGGYIFGGNLTLDASGLAQPVTLRTTAPMEKSFLSFVPNSPGLTPSIVARNIAFAGHRLVRTGASEGDWSMGGVISMQGGHSVAVFESCAFRDNELFFRSSGSGGCGVAGVRVVSPVLARFDDCVFESNTATCQANNAAGGAVGIVDPVGPVSFTRCRWTNNKVTATIPLPNSRPYSSGAAVFLQNEQPATQPVSFTECVFEENEAHVAPHNMVSNIDTTVCGAVCGDTHVGKPVLLNMTFARCSFTGNTATARLPADAQDTAKTRLTAYGAAVGLMVGSTARFTDCLIKHNVARVEGISSVTGHVNRAYGGGVLLNGAAASFEGTHFLDNSAVSPVDARGGALYTTGANNPALAQGDHALIIVRSTFSGNRAMAPGPAGRSAYGGALGVACTSTSKTCRIPVHMADCRVLENSARLQVTVATGAGAAAYARTSIL